MEEQRHCCVRGCEHSLGAASLLPLRCVGRASQLRGRGVGGASLLRDKGASTEQELCHSGVRGASALRVSNVIAAERGVSTALERRHRCRYTAWEARGTGVRGVIAAWKWHGRGGRQCRVTTAWEGRHHIVEFTLSLLKLSVLSMSRYFSWLVMSLSTVLRNIR